jgi:hypothetical protein
MAAVLADRKFTPTQKSILIRLALHFNIEKQCYNPRVKRIATGSGVSERAVQSALAAARARAVIDVDVGGGRKKTSNHRLLLGWIDMVETPHGHAPFVETPHGETLFDGALNGAALGEKGARTARANAISAWRIWSVCPAKAESDVAATFCWPTPRQTSHSTAVHGGYFDRRLRPTSVGDIASPLRAA